MTKPATIELDRERAFDWLMKGAQPTDTARAILRFKGVMYRKHLERGVRKGALTVEQAEAKWAEWIAAKENKIAERVAATQQEKADFLTKLSGSAPVIAEPEPEPEVEAETEAPAAEEAATEEVAEATEEAAPEAEATEEAAPEAEATEEAPAAEDKEEA